MLRVWWCVARCGRGRASPRTRFRYLYQEEELEPWAPRIKELAAQTEEVHVLMNNCGQDYAVVNAHQLGMVL